MQDNAFKVYPSGFVGSPNVRQTVPLDVVATAKQIFNNSLVKKSNPYTANLEVIELWMAATAGGDECKTFDFKERVLKCAIDSFGTDRIMDWIENQFKCEHLNYNHIKWLDETIAYVYGSVPRELSSSNWCMLLRAGDGEKVSAGLTPTIKAYLFNRGALENRSHQSIRQFIVRWVAQKGGIEDLLASIYVLYGKR